MDFDWTDFACGVAIGAALAGKYAAHVSEKLRRAHWEQLRILRRGLGVSAGEWLERQDAAEAEVRLTQH